MEVLDAANARLRHPHVFPNRHMKCQRSDHLFGRESTDTTPLTPPWLPHTGWSADISDDDALRELLALNGGGQ